MTDQSSGPSQRASLHPITGGAVLFDDAEGRLYALNPAAGLTWLCIAQGLSKHESTLVLADTFEIDSSMAAEWFHVSMAKFQDLGLFERGQAKARAPVARNALPGSRIKGSLRSAQQEYRLLDQIVRVSAPDEPLAAIDTLLGTLRSVSANCNQRALQCIEINVVAQGEKWDITLDGDLEATCDTISIVAEVERVLVQRVVPVTPHLLTFHAAALQRHDRTLLLAGVSGAGKTTLSLALTRAGWCFGSDEIVLLGVRDMRALPLPPCIKEDSFPLIESWFPELRTAPKHQRYGHTVKYLPMASTSTTFSSLHGSVVFLRFDPSGPNEIKPVDRFVALERLLAQCVFVPPGFQHPDVEQLLLWHAEQTYFDLSFCDSEAAVAILASVDTSAGSA
jgi:hypothetical protein